ncbi:endonuclease domain-containing 1 protein-like [Tachysurus fulvidraco]|uniref:endonuclease domain-containing 1 protein-like n=1 Tax=Tachysurus fulvidraco TaxID=1234273 RepID=UPI001FEDEE5F|nr:endonuclease domain-containing 1 protein-like [Tachysurus fulvidraco]
MQLLALVLLLSSLSSLTLTEVVNSFKQSCPNFFIRNPKTTNDFIVPTIFPGQQYKKICQRWDNSYRFATVYDTVRRIPVYSAYTLLQAGKTVRRDEWKIEPQLEDIEEYKDSKEMIDSPSTASKTFNQAVYSDYSCTGFTRGQVFPCRFTADQEQADSTFALTNIAPQAPASNEKWVKRVETPMLNDINKSCKRDKNHLVYIVTGVVPGRNWMNMTRDGREYQEGINIPSHAWSAYYCRNIKDPNNFIVKAYLAKMESFNLRHPDINRLESELTELYNVTNRDGKATPFYVFPGLDLNLRNKSFL